MTDLELAAVQAYVRLVRGVRATLDDTSHPTGAPPLLHEPMAETDRALRAAGMAGNEARLFQLVAERMEESGVRLGA
ncbi:hypothetical protein QIS99_01755 [Streptomyces sp. B-S-A8]|uniref:Uncharacterized protein n=1 Tax=Streptomyces solicavernae TaxID=3043614 RepID=A0ABT6RKJ1_9ACTN|nr:hypothetical protein [Streptomyces sp. B-S-A8]MDI3384946.1 hypothetical protein [Streptomyces sp. B-S-A8]